MDAKEIQERRMKAIQEVVDDDDLLALDPEASPDKYDFSTYAKRFEGSMDARQIKITEGEYCSRTSVMSFECGTCGHAWSAQAHKAQQYGCPKCRKLHMNIAKDRRLWERSKKIIRDKKGKIIQLPSVQAEKAPTVQDEFLLMCHKGHRFTFSHKRLYNDQWCPICVLEPGYKTKLTSKHVYEKNMSRETKFIRYCEIASLKGATILDAEWQPSKYTVLCQVCGSEQQLRAKQICDNRYLCKKRCTKGHRYTLYG